MCGEAGQAQPGAAAASGGGLAGRTAARAGQRGSSVTVAAAEDDRLPGTILPLCSSGGVSVWWRGWLGGEDGGRLQLAAQGFIYIHK